MSIHSTLKIAGGMRGERNVWTRAERIAVLKKEGKWHDGDSVLGLPKVRTRFKVKTKKQLKADTAAATQAEQPEAAAAEQKKEGE